MRRCTVDGCDAKHFGRGWCRRHYKKLRSARCSVEGCERPVDARGWCVVHYERHRRRGGDVTIDARLHVRRRDVMERILERIVVTARGCWEWQGHIMPTGYGQIFAEGRHQYVHRVAWEAANGPMPAGHQGHHTCQVRRCCNPDHIEPMPAGDHQRHHHHERRRVAA